MLHDYIMNFEVVEGKRLNSLLYQSGGYQYLKGRGSKNFTYVRCTLYKNPGCKGFAKIHHESNTLLLTHVMIMVRMLIDQLFSNCGTRALSNGTRWYLTST